MVTAAEATHLSLVAEVRRLQREEARLRAALETTRRLAGRSGPRNMIEALNQIEATAGDALTHEQTLDGGKDA